MRERPTVWRNLRHWSLHVALSAAASFVFACRGGWGSPQAVVGMLAGVALFIALYTWLWSTDWFHRQVPPDSAGRRALLYGTRVRSAFGALGFLNVVGGTYPNTPLRALDIFFVPDLWAGVYACEFVTAVTQSEPARLFRFYITDAGAPPRAHHVFVGSIDSLLPTFLITVAEGLLLTAVLLAISGFCRVPLSLYARIRPTLRAADPTF